MPTASRQSHTARTADDLIVAVRPLDALAPLLVPWRSLSRETLVENVFYEPEFASAAAEGFGSGVHLLLVGDRPPEERGARLLALWPFRIVRRWGLPIPVLMGWTHGFSIFGVPLLAKDLAEQALRALLAAPHHLGLPRRMLMPYLPLDGPFAGLIDSLLAKTERRRADFWAHERGFLDLADGGSARRNIYLATHLSARRARQFGRFARRLSEDGPIEHDIARDLPSLEDALADYVALESKGWKGKAGTAVGQRPAELGLLSGLAKSYAPQGRIRIDRLRRGRNSLAASLSLQSGSTFWFLKISHDENEARNSPGALLVERVTRSLLDDPAVTTADSCAPPNFPLIETFWAERRRLAHGLIEAGDGDRLFPLAVMLEGLRAQASKVRVSLSTASAG